VTDEEQQSLRQQAFDLIATSRSRVNPTTTEHIAETAIRHAAPDLDDYARFIGWKFLVKLQEDQSRAEYRPTRSGHKNRSGRYSFFQTPWRIGDLAKPLGEMNLAELKTVIAGYLQRAEESTAEANRLQAIANAMVAEGVELVKDLDEDHALALYQGEEVASV
jgi:hypothetical protein